MHSDKQLSFWKRDLVLKLVDMFNALVWLLGADSGVSHVIVINNKICIEVIKELKEIRRQKKLEEEEKEKLGRLENN